MSCFLQTQLMARDMRLIKALRLLRREQETIPVASRLKYLKAELDGVIEAEPDSVDVAREAAAKAPKKAALPPLGGAAGTRGDSNLVAVAKQFQLQVAVLENPDSFAAYGQSYAMVEQQMGLIALEIQVRTAMYARCSHQFPLHHM